MTAKIFLSYARSDGTKAAAALIRLLDSEGLNTWQDLRELGPEQSVWPQIEAALRDAGHLIVLVTDAALTSPYIRREWREARRNGATVHPVLAVNTPRATLPRWLRRGEVYRLDDPAHLTKFLGRLRLPGRGTKADWDRGLKIEAHVDRTTLFNDIKARLLADDAAPLGLSSALHGQGGYGKTVLAGRIARDIEVRDAFIDGVFWVSIGQDKPQLLEKLNALIQRIGGRPGAVDIDSAAEELAKLLDKRDVLLIVDDVWRRQDLAPFCKAVGNGPACLLATTRIADALPAKVTPITVAAMTPEEAMEVLARDLNPNPKDGHSLRAFAERFWFWPQLLAIANGILAGRVRDGELLGDAVQRLTLSIQQGIVPGEDQEKGTIHAVMDQGLKALTDTDRDRMRQMAIFPEDTPVPLVLLSTLWTLDQLSTDELAGRFVRNGLFQSRDLTGAVENHTIRLHDNMLWFLATTTPKATIADTHSRLVQAAKPASGNWRDLAPDAHYLWRHLGRHLHGAGHDAAARGLLGDFGWLRVKLNLLGFDALIVDFLPHLSDPSANLVFRALQLSRHALTNASDDLGWQIWARLGRNADPQLHQLVNLSRQDCGALVPITALLDPPAGQVFRRKGKIGEFQCVAFAPGGHRIVSGGHSGHLQIWEARTGNPLGDPFGWKQGWIQAVAFSPDGSRIIASLAIRKESYLKIFDATTKEAVCPPMKGHKSWISSAAFSPDGVQIATASDDATVRFWDAATGKSLWSPSVGHLGRVNCVAYSPDGRHVISGGQDGSIRYWDAQTGHPAKQPVLGHDGPVNSVVFSFDGTVIHSGGDDGTIRRWDAATGMALGEPMRGHVDRVCSLAVSPDNTKIVSGGEDGVLRLWTMSGGESLDIPLLGHKSRVTCVNFSPNGHHVVSCGDDDTLQLWDIQDNQAQSSAAPTPADTSVFGLAFCLDGKMVASCGRDGPIRISNPASGEMAHAPILAPAGWVNCLAFSPDGQHIVGGGEDGMLRRWNTRTGTPMDGPWPAHSGGIHCVAMSPDGKRIATGGIDHMLRVWDTMSQTKLIEHRHSATVPGVAFSPDGKTVASLSNGMVGFWDAATGAASGRPLGDTYDKSLACFAYSADGRFIVGGGYYGAIQCFDAQTFQPMGPPHQGHDAQIRSIAFSPNGKMIVSVSDDETLRLWDTKSLRAMSVLHFDTRLNCVATSLGHVAVGDPLGNVHLFEWAGPND